MLGEGHLRGEKKRLEREISIIFCLICQRFIELPTRTVDVSEM